MKSTLLSLALTLMLAVGLLSAACHQTRARRAPARGADGAAVAWAPVHFAFNRDQVISADRPVLEQHAAALQQNSKLVLVLEGHTDERGAAAYNLQLGDRRARAVKTKLVQHGIDPARLVIISYGQIRPAQPGRSPAASRANRRVEFVPR